MDLFITFVSPRNFQPSDSAPLQPLHVLLPFNHWSSGSVPLYHCTFCSLSTIQHSVPVQPPSTRSNSSLIQPPAIRPPSRLSTSYTTRRLVTQTPGWSAPPGPAPARLSHCHSAPLSRAGPPAPSACESAGRPADRSLAATGDRVGGGEGGSRAVVLGKRV